MMEEESTAYTVQQSNSSKE